MEVKYQLETLDLNEDHLPEEYKLSRSRVLYIENKSEGLEGTARIGRVYFSK